MIKIIRARNIMVYIMAAVLILFMGISQVMPSYADTGGVNGGFVITDGVLTSYTGTDKEITIPDTVTEIGENAFKNSECTSVTIPSSVKKIGKSAFFNASVAKIDIPSSVESLDSMAFYAAKLKEVTFHEGLKTIGYGAFAEVTFPAGTTIEIPESVTEVGGEAFESLGLGSAGGSSIKILNKDTVLGSGFAAYYNTVKIYGHKGSTAETYVTSQKESKGDKCKLEFVDIDSAQDVAVSSVTVTPSVLSLTTGASETLKAEVLPENATDRKVTWTSDDDKIASVDDTGKVTAVAAGTTEIKASAGEKSAVCKVTVSDPADFEITDGVLTAYNGKDTKVSVPSGVKEIASGAFSKATAVTELTIPEGVTSIAAKAFSGMNALETLNLPASLKTVGSDGTWFGEMFVNVSSTGTPQATPAKLTAVNVADGGSTYSSADGVVYSADGSTLIYCPAAKTSIKFSDKITAIDKYAFYKSSIEKMELPDSLETIGKMAFMNSSVRYLEFPGTMKAIDQEAFFNAQLRSVDLNEGLETIGDRAFSVSHVVGITIPASVKSIGEGAFDYEYSGDRYIVIKGSDTELAKDAIPYYYALDVYAPSGSKTETFVKNEKESRGDKCKMVFHALDEFRDATSITLGENDIRLSRQETKTLTVIASPEGARIPVVVWSSSDKNIVKVTDKGEVTGIEPGTAEVTARAGRLTAVCKVNVVKKEGESDFTVTEDGIITGFLGSDMSKLEIPEEIGGTTVKGIEAGAFKEKTDIKEVVLPKTLTTIGEEAFSGCTKLTSINLSSVTEIGKSSFSNTAVEKITLGEGMTTIPESAFSNCKSLTKVVLPETIEKIEEKAFRNCSALTRITLNEGLKTIGQEAFLGAHLSTLHLPSTFENMGGKYMGDVFEEAGKTIADNNMKAITVSGDNPLYSSYNGILYNKDGDEVVFCPRGRTSVKVADGVTKIRSYAFFMCFDLEKVTLPSTLKTIGKGAFQYDEGLTDCELPEGLEVVEDSAFFGAENWTGVDRIPSTVKSIGAYGFAECKGKKLVIPEGITTIEPFSFWGYEEGLEEIILPSTLKTISASAFSWAKDVKKLVIPEGVTSIGNEAFARMDSLEELSLPSTLETIGAKAFMGKDGSNALKLVHIPSSVTDIADDSFINREDMTVKADSKDSTAAKFALEKGMKLQLGSVADMKISISTAKFTYSGKAYKPSVTVEGLEAGTDYTVSYKNNKAIGTGRVEITGKGYYTGTTVKTFSIVPAKAKLRSVKAGKRSASVKIGKQSGGVSYQIAYKKSGAGSWKTISTVKTSRTIKSLKKGKRYTVKVRAYKKVSGKTYYGAWSKTKTVKSK